MTKPAVWVQFIIKKNNGGENKLLNLKYQLAENYGCFCFVIIKIYVHKLFCLILILNLD